jgi:hypothetical protein
MYTKFATTLSKLVTSSPAIYKMWGAGQPMCMGDGIRFRVTKSPKVDYVYIRYYDGFQKFEVEFAALVGTEYDVIDRIKPVSASRLLSTISQKLFFDTVSKK